MSLRKVGLRKKRRDWGTCEDTATYRDGLYSVCEALAAPFASFRNCFVVLSVGWLVGRLPTKQSA